MKNIFIVTVLFACFLVSTVSAAPMPGVNRTAMLNSALADMQCRVTFDTDWMNAIIAVFPSLLSSLTPRIEALQVDMTQLSQYASQGDARNYNTYVQEVFTQNLKLDAETIREGLDTVKLNKTRSKNETKAALDSLKATHKTLKDAQDSCFGIRTHADLVLNYYNNTLDRYQLRAQNLSDRGLNVSNLFELVESARAQILVPLQNEINSATNASELRLALHRYCLYDGCKNGTNFHMAAKFEKMRVADLLAVVSPKAIEANFSSNITIIQTSLNAASTAVDSWADNDVLPDQLRAAWEDIRAAAKGLHEIFVALKSSGGAE